MSRRSRKTTPFERRSLFLYSDKKCFYCRRKLRQSYKDKTRDTRLYVIDHFFPYSKGGKTEWGNLVPSCYFCNFLKRATHPKIFCPKRWKEFQIMKNKKKIDLSPAKMFRDRITYDTGMTVNQLLKFLKI